jgi:solute:Na+ symporter, SSS family
MHIVDWIILSASLIFIVVYGIWKGRGSRNIQGYLLANKSLNWYTIALSIMATQASAITFLSAPGQAYVDGMRFVQYYFGLPIAMVILSMTAVPIFHRLNVYTAYEYLENRFDMKTRGLAAILFLTQRGLAAGLTILAPGLILSIIFGWNLTYTNFIIGALVITYTAWGGTKAVNFTNFHQLIIALGGMVCAFIMLVYLLPADVSFLDAIKVSGKMGRLNAIDFTFDLNNKYNIWSGILGGTFLALSYFGTDQSQVQRYLTGKSVVQSRVALLFNGLVKIPMQFFILFVGAMVFVFYQFERPPIFFNSYETGRIKSSVYSTQFTELEKEYENAHDIKMGRVRELVGALRNGYDDEIESSENAVKAAQRDMTKIRTKAIALMKTNDPGMDVSDINYIFLTFVTDFLPVGIVGLVIAMVFAASMSSTSSELNALASTFIVDIYKRLIKRAGSERHYLIASKLATVFWGLFAIWFANFVSGLGSLIEAVNILGSLFYGTILGIFLTAFYFKPIRGGATFFAAIIGELVVLSCYFLKVAISFLWYNVIGCVLVIFLAHLLSSFTNYRISKRT